MFWCGMTPSRRQIPASVTAAGIPARGSACTCNPGREVANHDDLMARLKSSVLAGVVVKEFEACGSSRGQLEQFARSTVIVAPHGAGLSNVVAARPGTAVVELMVPGADLNACYLFASVKLGLRYYSTAPRGASHNGAMNVDVDEVTDLVMQGLKAAVDSDLKSERVPTTITAGASPLAAEPTVSPAHTNTRNAR